MHLYILRSIRACARCLSICALAATLLTSARGAPVCPVGTVVQGIDVSSSNGTIDWTKVSGAGIGFAYAQATDGNSSIDPQFATNYAGIKAAGIARGAYHFLEPALDGVSQANFFLGRVGTLGAGDLPPMLDVEITGGQAAGVIATDINQWINTVQRSTGRTPVIRTLAGFWNGSVQTTIFSVYPLWILDPGVTCPTLPTGWQNWMFWLYSTTGSLPGITSGTVYRDEFNGSSTALRDIAGEIQITVAASANPSPLRRSVTFTAAVNSGTATTPTGTVAFMDGSTRLATPITLNSGQASFKTNQLALGRHSITAVYSGDFNFPGNTSSALIFYRSPKPH